MGLVPGLMSPTADKVVPLGCALLTFVFYHVQGFRRHGFGYIKQFLGAGVVDGVADAARWRSSPTVPGCCR